MGERWLARALEAAPASSGHCIQLWNVVAVEALAAYLEALPSPD
jgi:hypothetical protein